MKQCKGRTPLDKQIKRFSASALRHTSKNRYVNAFFKSETKPLTVASNAGKAFHRQYFLK